MQRVTHDYKSVALFILLMFSVVYTTVAQTEYKWQKLGELLQARVKVSASYIGNGKIVVAGGFIQAHKNKTDFTCTNLCEEIDVNSRKVTSTVPMIAARAEFPLLITKDSNLIAVSGAYDDGQSTGGENQNTTLVEMYDRSTKTWTEVGNLLLARRQHAATFINDNEILVVGGRIGRSLATTNVCEIFNINTGVSRLVAPYPIATCQVLCETTVESKIIACAGRTGGSNSARYHTVYNYSVANNQWIAFGSIAQGVQGASLLKLWNGRLVFSGGASKDWKLETSNTIWKDDNGGYYNVGSLVTPRMQHESAQWSNDTIVVTGGWENDYNVSLKSTEMLDVHTGKSIQIAPMLEPHTWHKMVAIPNEYINGKKIQNASVIVISGVNEMLMDAGGNAVGFTFTPSVEILEHPKCTQTFYANGFREAQLYGSATRTNSSLRLTDNTEFNVGACWTKSKISVIDAFNCSFQFKLTKGFNNSIDDGSEPGADGFAFVIQNNNNDVPLRAAEYLGYDGLANSLAVEFDTYNNSTTRNDPNGNHIAVQSNGLNPNSSYHSLLTTKAITSRLPTLKNDSIYFVTIHYDAVGKNLEIFMDTEGGITTPVLVATNIDFSTLLHLDNGKAWVGFTGSTGTAWSYQEILEWNIERCVPLSSTSVNEDGTTLSNVVSVYPQPAQNLVHIVLPDSYTNSNVQIRIIDVVGNIVTTLHTGTQNLHQNHLQWMPNLELANGFYIVQVLDGTHCNSAFILLDR